MLRRGRLLFAAQLSTLRFFPGGDRPVNAGLGGKLESVSFDTDTYEEELLKKRGTDNWVHLPPHYIKIRQK